MTVKTGVFLVEPGMLGSGGRYLHAAPIGQRYVFVSVVLTWEGEQTREIRFRSDGGTSASIQLGVLDERIDPVGRVVPDPGPLRPVATDSMVLEPGARSAFEVVFALPEAVVEANLLVDGRVHLPLTIPGDAPSPPSTWVGTWRRGAETIGPMRYGRPLLDALVGSDARVMKIQQRLDGLTVVSVPSASISSDGEVDTRNGKEHRTFTWLRATCGKRRRCGPFVAGRRFFCMWAVIVRSCFCTSGVRVPSQDDRRCAMVIHLAVS